MDVNEHERLSNITRIEPNKKKGTGHYCCSTFHNHSM